MFIETANGGLPPHCGIAGNCQYISMSVYSHFGRIHFSGIIIKVATINGQMSQIKTRQVTCIETRAKTMNP
jgi:hypothetical protein